MGSGATQMTSKNLPFKGSFDLEISYPRTTKITVGKELCEGKLLKANC